MFLTANSLQIQYGIDEEIARFFVDRDPPKDNLYWKDKLLYLRPQPGYIFLPLITDLYYRSGISRKELLSEGFVGILEKIGDVSAKQEFGMMTKDEVLKACFELVKNKTTNNGFLTTLVDYFKGINNHLSQLSTPFRALHRGDYFLFSLAALNASQEKLDELVSTWFALISCLLLMDDAEDFEKDIENGEENAFIESGSNKDGFEKIKQLVSDKLSHLSVLNNTLANALHKRLASLAEKPFIKEYLNR